ncbi:hypothetical protein D3C81_2248850 [compost metagenome]
MGLEKPNQSSLNHPNLLLFVGWVLDGIHEACFVLVRAVRVFCPTIDRRENLIVLKLIHEYHDLLIGIIMVGHG